MLRSARFGQEIRLVDGMAVLRCREHYGGVLPDTEDVAIADMPAKPASVRMGGIKQQRAVAFLRRHAQHLQRRLTRCRRRGGGFLRRQCVERIKSAGNRESTPSNAAQPSHCGGSCLHRRRARPPPGRRAQSRLCGPGRVSLSRYGDARKRRRPKLLR